jgi:predicted nucleotidyltransferase
MQSDSVTKKLIEKLSSAFSDFKGLYHYGSRVTNTNRVESDYDYILIFENTGYEKELEIAGIISIVEYEEDAEIDYRIFTTEGNRSIGYIRKEVNPVFINKAVDNGIYYGRL